MNYLVYLIILIGLSLSILKPYYFIIFFGLFGSEYGAKGFTGYFDNYFAYYSLIMQMELIIALIVSLLYFFKLNRFVNNTYFKYIFISICLIISMIISLCIYFIYKAPDGNIIARIMNCICNFGPAIFIIWISYKDIIIKKKKLFIFYSVIQCIIAFMIIYLPEKGLTFFKHFNAGYYNESTYYYLDEYNSFIARINNFYLTFIGKKNSYFVRCGQFHNSNGLGLATGVLIFLLINQFLINIKKKKIFKSFICLPLIFLTFVLWCNSGMRGAIYAILLDFIISIIYILFTKKIKIKTIVYCIIIFFILTIFVMNNTGFLDFIFGDSASDSFNSRINLLSNVFKNINKYLLIGNGGDLDTLVAINIDPHFVSLRILCMYGIIPSILSFILIFVLPLIDIIRRKKVDFYLLGCFLLVIFTAITNNYVEIVLYWVLLAEFVLYNTEQKKIKKDQSHESIISC